MHFSVYDIYFGYINVRCGHCKWQQLIELKDNTTDNYIQVSVYSKMIIGTRPEQDNFFNDTVYLLTSRWQCWSLGLQNYSPQRYRFLHPLDKLQQSPAGKCLQTESF